MTACANYEDGLFRNNDPRLQLAKSQRSMLSATGEFLFGGSKLPKLARSLGEAQREFKHGQNELAADEALRAEAEAQLRMG